jgi:hypothetical protein
MVLGNLLAEHRRMDVTVIAVVCMTVEGGSSGSPIAASRFVRGGTRCLVLPNERGWNEWILQAASTLFLDHPIG